MRRGEEKRKGRRKRREERERERSEVGHVPLDVRND
jgi:hypothetical protein